jgi:hypothetical protein
MALGTVRRALRGAQDGERKVPKFSRSVGRTAVQDLGYGHSLISLSSIIIINIKGCALGRVLYRPYGEVTIGLLASLAGKLDVPHVDSPINESSVLLPATLTTSCFRGPRPSLA